MTPSPMPSRHEGDGCDRGVEGMLTAMAAVPESERLAGSDRSPPARAGSDRDDGFACMLAGALRHAGGIPGAL